MSLDREINSTESPYTNGPYVVLSDGSTYDGAEDCAIAFVTDEGQKQLEECYEFKAVEDDDMELIMLSDLIDAYNKVHGTNI
jgi:hypothetical protein